MTFTFDEWRGNEDGRPVFFIKKLAKAFGCVIQLHKFVAPDDAGCFHSHPAFAIRIVLRGGYVEETKNGFLISRHPGYIGLVRPEFEHRIHALINKRESWSLWLRGPKIAPISYGCD
jgi:hypothetical protein